MPSIEKHVETSRLRTGNDYGELRKRIDGDPGAKRYGACQRVRRFDEVLMPVKAPNVFMCLLAIRKRYEQ
jgi:hypothetical protein